MYLTLEIEEKDVKDWIRTRNLAPCWLKVLEVTIKLGKALAKK